MAGGYPWWGWGMRGRASRHKGDRGSSGPNERRLDAWPEQFENTATIDRTSTPRNPRSSPTFDGIDDADLRRRTLPHELQGIGVGFVPSDLHRDNLHGVLSKSASGTPSASRSAPATNEGILVGRHARRDRPETDRPAGRRHRAGVLLTTLASDTSPPRGSSTPHRPEGRVDHGAAQLLHGDAVPTPGYPQRAARDSTR